MTLCNMTLSIPCASDCAQEACLMLASARTVVRDTPEDRAVGTQQKTARPKLSSGRARGRACTGSAMRGVTASTTTQAVQRCPPAAGRPQRLAPSQVQALRQRRQYRSVTRCTVKGVAPALHMWQVQLECLLEYIPARPFSSPPCVSLSPGNFQSHMLRI